MNRMVAAALTATLVPILADPTLAQTQPVPVEQNGTRTLNPASANDSFGNLDVKAFGAKGDGSADDASAFQNAVNQAGLAGAKLILPAGRFNLNSGVGYSGLFNLQGAGSGAGPGFTTMKGSVVLPTFARGDVLSSTSLYGSTFRDFQIGYKPSAPACATVFGEFGTCNARSSGAGLHILGPTTPATQGMFDVSNVATRNMYDGISLTRPGVGSIEKTFHVNWKNSGIHCDTTTVEPSCGFLSQNFLFGDSDPGTSQVAAMDLHGGYTKAYMNLLLGSQAALLYTCDNYQCGNPTGLFNTIENMVDYGIRLKNGAAWPGAQAQFVGNELLTDRATTGASVKAMIQIDRNSRPGSPWMTDVSLLGNVSRGELTRSSGGPASNGHAARYSIDGVTNWSIANAIDSWYGSDTSFGVTVGPDARNGQVFNFQRIKESDGSVDVNKYDPGATWAHTQVVDWQGLPYAKVSALAPAAGSQIWCSDCAVKSDQTIADHGPGVMLWYMNGGWVPLGRTFGKAQLANGGTAADLSATGGPGQVLKQPSVGATITVGALSGADISGCCIAPGSGGTGLDTTVSSGIPHVSAGKWQVAPIANSDLAPMANNTIKSNISSAQGMPSDNSVTSVVDTLGSTRGSVLSRGASGWAGLTPGPSGYPLVSQGTGADPVYAQVNLASAVGGTLPVSNGGTGVTSLTPSKSTPIPSCGTGTFAASVNSLRMGNMTFVDGQITIANIGSCRGRISVVLPQTARPAVYGATISAQNPDTGAVVIGSLVPGTSTLELYTPSFGRPGTTGEHVNFSGQYFN